MWIMPTGFVHCQALPARRQKKRLGIAYPYRFASSLAIGWPRGNPDAMVTRQTHATTWFENGTVKTVF